MLLEGKMAIKNSYRSIVFIVPYFGQWPIWFPAFLVSCKHNSTINWIFFTDCEIPFDYPKNVKFLRTTLPDIQLVFSEKIGITINIQHPVKFCDLKPTYGHVFEELLKDYDFWGFCDIDIIWGDIRKFITEEMLNNFDLISSRLNTISGHFTILKNNPFNRLLYKKGGRYEALFLEPKYSWFDENTFATIVSEYLSKGELKVWWDKYLVNHERGSDSHQEYFLDRWVFDNGKLFDRGYDLDLKIEHMYLHFINWKVTMKTCEVSFDNPIEKFYVSYSSINYQEHTFLDKMVNSLKIIINGYYKKENRRIFKRKLIKYAERIKRKLNSITFNR